MSNYDGADFGEIETELDPEPPPRPRRWPRVVGIILVLLLGAAAGWIARSAVIPTEVDQAAPGPGPTVTITATPEAVDSVGSSSTVPPACLEALDITERLIDWIGRYDQAVTEGASDEEFQLLEEEITNLGGLWGMTEPVCREPIN